MISTPCMMSTEALDHVNSTPYCSDSMLQNVFIIFFHRYFFSAYSGRYLDLGNKLLSLSPNVSTEKKSWSRLVTQLSAFLVGRYHKKAAMAARVHPIEHLT